MAPEQPLGVSALNTENSQRAAPRRLPLQGYPSAPPNIVVTQPATTIVVPEVPAGWSNVPLSNRQSAHLDYLSGLDQLRVRALEEEECTKLQLKKQFQIKSVMGDTLYYAVEDSSYLARVCCGPIHPFTVKIVDPFGNQVISLKRPVPCEFCFFCFYPQKLEIFSASGAFMGAIQEEFSVFSASFLVKDRDGKVILKIQGPCVRSWCGAVNFQVISADSVTPLGKITREWSDCIQECISDANNFRVTFPRDLNVGTKSLLLGACFLIDYMFFEYKLTRVCLNRRTVCIFLSILTLFFMIFVVGFFLMHG